MVEVKLPQIASGEIILEQILFISVLEWTVSRDYWKMCGMKGFDAGESRNFICRVMIIVI